MGLRTTRASNGRSTATSKSKALPSKNAANAKSEDTDSTGSIALAKPGKRKRVAVKQEEDIEQAVKTEVSTTKTKKSKTSATASEPDTKMEADSKIAAKLDEAVEAVKPSKAPSKSNPYGLSPGQSPYPNYPHPTPEECRKVVDILQREHGKVSAPKTIPTPSLNTSGCGEVPSVLDALVRTRLSAATNNANSSRAFRGLVERFGIIDKGVGKGSVNWDAVRKAPVGDVFEAIKSGGLADVKSRDIQKILQMVYEENQERKRALITANVHQSEKRGPKGIKHEPEAERKQEIEKAESNILSLDHLHLMTSEEAFDKLIGYPGVGPKTASCVLLFCLQRPSFAVDTHVFRLCKLLKWVPLKEKPTRNSTYAHCDVRVPDDLKYQLHYLLIRHGKECRKCSAALQKSGTCPMDSLMNRNAARKSKDGE